MILTNIYPLNKIGKDMIRQKVEMYLPLQILHNKQQYDFLKNDKQNKIDVYKICDTNVGDPQYSKGLPCSIEQQLEAAEIIDADEITLTDKIIFDENGMKPTYQSTALSMQAYFTFQNQYKQKFPNLKLGWVVQAENFDEWQATVEIVVNLPDIETIMIPKWECYTSMWGTRTDHRGRIFLTKRLREIEQQNHTKHHRVHWLGNCNSYDGYGMMEYIDFKSTHDFIDVQSSDTGLYIAELAQTGKYDLFAGRPKNFEIDLLNGEFNWGDVQKLVDDENKLLNLWG